MSSHDYDTCARHSDHFSTIQRYSTQSNQAGRDASCSTAKSDSRVESTGRVSGRLGMRAESRSEPKH
jgi:hypothetical protein